MVVIEVAGFLFGVFMLYITHISLKKKQMSTSDAIVWGAIWLGVMAFAVFSQQLQASIKIMGLVRVFDFVMIAGFVLLFAIIFFLFRKIRVLESKIDSLVGKIMQKKKLVR